MKKIVSLLVTIILIVSVLTSMVLIVKAHPGRTDSNGGHTDHSTGEYHYHHGYSAHDHFDMDGDGDLDCPYDFDDQTNKKSGHQSTNNNKNENILSLPETRQDTKKVNPVPPWVYCIIAGLVISVLICIWIIRKKTIDLQNAQAQFDHYVNKTRKMFAASAVIPHSRAIMRADEINRKTIESLPTNAKIDFRDPFPLDFFEDFENDLFPFELPYGVTATKNGSVALGYISEKRPFGKYTVFISRSGKCYHTPYCSHTQGSLPVCIFTAMQYRRTPCYYCRPESPSSIPKWFTNFCEAARSFKIDWNDVSQ